MATQPRENLDFEEQRIRILRAIEEVETFAAGSRKLNAESIKAEAARSKLNTDVRLSPPMLLAQGMIAGAALLGAGAALAKLLLP